jgi:hypothetical protein
MTRLWTRIQRLASVASGVLLLSGCAAQSVDLPWSPAREHIAVRLGRPGFVVAAPHGATDVNTDSIAAEIARRTGFGLVLASGLATEPASAAPGGRTYEKRVLEVAQGPLRFYAEIHGAGRDECAGPIEIATVGVDRELALRLRALAELIRDAHLRASAGVQRLDVLVEPADAVRYRAAGVRRDGILRLPQRGLHIELPRCARRDWRDTYAAILADFLAQTVTLPVGR